VSSDQTAVPEIDPEEARRLADAGVFLLDVREDEEWAAGRAPDAVHVAMGSIADRIDVIPKDRTVVCVCRSGARSAAVTGALVDAGYDARNLAGGMLAWEASGFPVVAAPGVPGRII
jgi:rhodanese-related sulfurtransferase